MSTTEDRSSDASETAGTKRTGMKLEVVVIRPGLAPDRL
jgi:hypothetical protein